MNVSRRLAAEALGTGFLVISVVGSGIMADRLAGGNAAVALLANTLATSTTLIALIWTFGPISGAHFNPAVTVAQAIRVTFTWREVPGYLVAQGLGACAGVVIAHAMFDQPLVQVSDHVRAGGAQILSEFIATFGLLSVILGCSARRGDAVPAAVGLYIAGAYWFTASTAFANPAVTLARGLTATFAGIRLADVPAFVAVQFAGALAATALFRWLLASPAPAAVRRGAAGL